MRPVAAARITVYVREGCHLCDDALAVLRPLADAHGALLETVDIEGDDALHRRYLERIPVTCLDGEELFDYFVDAADLTARLARAGRN